MFTGSSLVRVTGLGDGETAAILKDMVTSDNLALDTLTKVKYKSSVLQILKVC